MSILLGERKTRLIPILFNPVGIADYMLNFKFKFKKKEVNWSR